VAGGALPPTRSTTGSGSPRHGAAGQHVEAGAPLAVVHAADAATAQAAARRLQELVAISDQPPSAAEPVWERLAEPAAA
jgi:thymidine phosphorylase